MADVAAYVEDGQGEATATGAVLPAARLAALIEMPNIAAELDDQALAKIAATVCEEYDIDEESRRDWCERNDRAMDLAMLVAGEKNEPWAGASNVKYPLIITAALQFNARSYPAIVQGKQVAKCQTWGDDKSGAKAKRADRVSEHLSYQMLVQQPEWEEDTDRLLVLLPIAGSAFRKTWFDPSLGRKVSRLLRPNQLVVNYFARSLADVPRTTEIMMLYPYEIQERIRDGRFVEFDYGAAQSAPSDDGKEKDQGGDDKEGPHEFLEQHRLLDLDGDGYPEPYIVTVHRGLQKVCRIKANYSAESVRVTDDGRIASIRKETFYTKYQFLPSPDGGFYGLGFGHLLKDASETINTTLNQMFDAGTLANMQGGFINAGIGIKDRRITLERGEWRVLNTTMQLNQAIMPLSYPGPSAVLFNLLGLLIESAKELAGVKDVLTGDTPATAPVGTTLAMIEQGLQVFTSIYKRIHRSLKEELAIQARLNRQNLSQEEYQEFFDEQPGVDPKADYNDKDMDIVPVSDPTSVTRMQKLAKAQFAFDTGKDNPRINQDALYRRMYEAAEIEDSDDLIAPPPQPDPLMVMLGELEAQEKMADITQKLTTALKNVADAEAAEEGVQLNYYAAMIDALKQEFGMAQQMVANEQGGPGGLPGMEGAPDDAMGAGPAGQASAGNGAPPAGIPGPANDVAGAGLGEPPAPGSAAPGAL